MENTAEYILEKVAPVFNKQGYVGTSLSDLTKATKLTKGAIYCNFKNKEDLAIKSFHLNLQNAVSPLFKVLKTQENSIDKLRTLTNYYRYYYESGKSRGGCPILNVGVDSKYNHPLLFAEAQKETLKLISGLAKLIQNGIDKKEIIDIDAKLYAKNIYSMIEGAIFMAFTQEDRGYLDDILNHIDKEIIEKIKL